MEIIVEIIVVEIIVVEIIVVDIIAEIIVFSYSDFPLPNVKQQNPRGRCEAPPPGVPTKAAPCCLAFGKDFLCFCIISRAHAGSIFDNI